MGRSFGLSAAFVFMLGSGHAQAQWCERNCEEICRLTAPPIRVESCIKTRIQCSRFEDNRRNARGGEGQLLGIADAAARAAAGDRRNHDHRLGDQRRSHQGRGMNGIG